MCGKEIQQVFQFTTVEDREKNTAANFANGGNDFSSLNSSIYFQSRHHFAAAL